MWHPVLTGNADPMRHDGSPSWDGGAHCSGTFLPGSARLGAYIRRHFPFVYDVNGYACRPNTANADELSVHGTGRAIDLMIRPMNGQADRRGDEVANWLIQHAADIGVQLIIWDHTIWNNRTPNSAREYTASSHINHIHVELNELGARERTPFFTQGMDRYAPEPDDGPSILPALAIGVLVYWLAK